VQSARPQACAVVQTSGIPFEDNCPIGKESILAQGWKRTSKIAQSVDPLGDWLGNACDQRRWSRVEASYMRVEEKT
jgi:hypothetical protein